jgi:membrane-associated phospholipid phosphatase
MSRNKLILILVLFSSPAYAQEPVVKWADYSSWATAAVEPTVSVIEALRSNDKKCNLLKLGIKEAISNGTVLTIKHFVSSPRPCLGCLDNGMPSGHTANGFTGNNWQVSLYFGTVTGILRHRANRHTWTQVLAGAGIGVASNFIGDLMHCKE